jgi:hypothetical protein
VLDHPAHEVPGGRAAQTSRLVDTPRGVLVAVDGLTRCLPSVDVGAWADRTHASNSRSLTKAATTT